jgi:hypothetical protein
MTAAAAQKVPPDRFSDRCRKSRHDRNTGFLLREARNSVRLWFRQAIRIGSVEYGVTAEMSLDSSPTAAIQHISVAHVR